MIRHCLGYNDNKDEISFDALEFQLYLFICIDVFVEPLESIYIEFHQFSQKVKVTLKHISRLAFTVNNAVENMLQGKNILQMQDDLTFWASTIAFCFLKTTNEMVLTSYGW